MVRNWTDGGRNNGRQRLTDINFRREGREGYTCWPDFNDPATLGCLLHLVREAWGDPTVGVQAVMLDGGVTWRVFRQWPQHIHMLVAGTEADALVAALEAAP